MKKSKLISISSEEEFVRFLINKYKVGVEDSYSGLPISGIEFNYNVEIPLNDEVNQSIVISQVAKDQQKLIALEECHTSLKIENCEFKAGFKLRGKIDCNIEIADCTFAGVFDIKQCLFNGKLKVRDCHFNTIDFFNTTFSDLADFYKCHFHQKVIFLKTDFMKICVFAACIFHKNTLFTYTLIQKVVIFRGTTFYNWLDLSLSIGEGEFNLFDIKPIGLKLSSIDSNDLVIEDQEVYDDAVTKNGVIPIKNKRETLRLLKQTLVSQGNISESLDFKALEKETLSQELGVKQYRPKKKGENHYKFKKLNFLLGVKLDRFNLWLNWVSNNHGKSYGRAFLFVIGIGWLFFYLSLLATISYEFSLNPAEWEFKKGLEYFVQFLLPTHKFGYMSSDGVILTAGFYILDFFGRLLVGYGIYQFIQAFRKYK